uniref:Uncharacterized protein n=1 Tax=viral metagenome TaxID=1070528 RepID=A0A6C0B5J0_9ZZZZ
MIILLFSLSLSAKMLIYNVSVVPIIIDTDPI